MAIVANVANNYNKNTQRLILLLLITVHVRKTPKLNAYTLKYKILVQF